MTTVNQLKVDKRLGDDRMLELIRVVIESLGAEEAMAVFADCTTLVYDQLSDADNDTDEYRRNSDLKIIRLTRILGVLICETFKDQWR